MPLVSPVTVNPVAVARMRDGLSGVTDWPPGVVPAYTLKPVMSVRAASAAVVRSPGAAGGANVTSVAPPPTLFTSTDCAAAGVGRLTTCATAEEDEMAVPTAPR